MFSNLDFEKLVEVKYHVSVYEKNEVQYAFQEVENLGVLIEYESLNDFEGKSIEEIKSEKVKMYESMITEGLVLTDELDVKKAKELILKERFSQE